MADRRDTSHPPSDPHPAIVRGASAASLLGDDRPLRVQLFAALLLGLVLVASGLYLWRRPAAQGETASSDVPAAGSALAAIAVEAGAAAAQADAGAPSPVTLSDPRVLACQDKGSKRTVRADQCDRLPQVEQALAHAIEQNASCIPPAASSGGTIEYVADVSFARHKVNVSAPRAGRSVKDRRVVASCASAVRSAVQSLALDGMSHEHSRYKIAMTATYRSKT